MSFWPRDNTRLEAITPTCSAWRSGSAAPGTMLRIHGSDSLLSKVAGRELTGKVSPALYTIAIAAAFRREWIRVPAANGGHG